MREGFVFVGADLRVRPRGSPVEKARYLILTQKADADSALAHPRPIGEKIAMSTVNRNLTAAVEGYL